MPGERFKLAPFPCPNCSHEILVEAIRLSDDVSEDCATYEVIRSFRPSKIALRQELEAIEEKMRVTNVETRRILDRADQVLERLDRWFS